MQITLAFFYVNVDGYIRNRKKTKSAFSAFDVKYNINIRPLVFLAMHFLGATDRDFSTRFDGVFVPLLRIMEIELSTAIHLHILQMNLL